MVKILQIYTVRQLNKNDVYDYIVLDKLYIKKNNVKTMNRTEFKTLFINPQRR